MPPIQSDRVFQSINPATGEMLWRGAEASPALIETAVATARNAAGDWAALPVEQRIEVFNQFAARLKGNRAGLAEMISKEVGKPRWEALTEVDAMINKIPLSIQAFGERRRPTVTESAGVRAATRFKPHGVVAVLGPFNFPGHLPNGHIVPALLAGNAVIFKPSELAPGVAEATITCWRETSIPDGVIQCLQGGRTVGEALVTHREINGIFFTGSSHVGKAMRQTLADRPEKILAIEMGGNNPLIVHEASNVSAAVYHTIQSAFITAGQRCTCARRLIVPAGSAGDTFIAALTVAARAIRVGPPSLDPEPFMGPVINDGAAYKLLASQAELQRVGGLSLLEMKTVGDRPALLSPGLIDVTAIADRSDCEIFGPLLQVIRVADFDAAMIEANRTAYGLAAGLLSDKQELFDLFFQKIRAGVVSWNRPTTGASGSLPFGGIGASGNHRPSGYYAADHCSYAVGSLESERLELPATLTPGLALTAPS